MDIHLSGSLDVAKLHQETHVQWTDNPEPLYAMTVTNISAVPQRPVFLPKKTTVVSQEDILIHQKIALDSEQRSTPLCNRTLLIHSPKRSAITALLETIWDWIVQMESWEETSSRDPVIREARRDLETAFQVYKKYDFFRRKASLTALTYILGSAAYGDT
jgi:hypothetical protein